MWINIIIGETPDLDIRLTQHNQHHFKKNFTKVAADWKIVLSKNCFSKEEAIYLEKFIKHMKRKKFIEKIIEKHEILDDILCKR